MSARQRSSLVNIQSMGKDTVGLTICQGRMGPRIFGINLQSGEVVFLVPQLAIDSEQERQRCVADLLGVFGQHFVPLNVSFVSEFSVSRSGKFKVIEAEH